MRNFKRIEPRWKVWSEGRHNLPRQVGLIVAGFCHIWPQVYIQWKVRERMRERESIGTEFYYIWMTAKKKKVKSLPANYISVWMIFLPPPLLICFGPLWVFCFARIRLPFSFYSISRIQEERKKERNGLAAILPKFQGSVYGLEGVGGMGVGPTHGTF